MAFYSGAAPTAARAALGGGARAAPPPLRAQTPASAFSGQATLVSLSDIHNFPSPIIIGDTGPLPGAGGNLQVTVAGTNVDNGALTFDSGAASAVGGGSESRSDTSINNFNIQIMAMD